MLINYQILELQLLCSSIKCLIFFDKLNLNSFWINTFNYIGTLADFNIINNTFWNFIWWDVCREESFWLSTMWNVTSWLILPFYFLVFWVYQLIHVSTVQCRSRWHFRWALWDKFECSYHWDCHFIFTFSCFLCWWRHQDVCQTLFQDLIQILTLFWVTCDYTPPGGL